MNKNAIEFFRKMEELFGTHKIARAACIAGAVFLLCLAELPNDPKPVLPEPQNNENNKEEN